MTTVEDIQNGKYCPDCKADCRNFISESDCCSYDTFIGRLHTQVIKGSEEELKREIHYEPVKQTIMLTIIEKEILKTFYEKGNEWN